MQTGCTAWLCGRRSGCPEFEWLLSSKESERTFSRRDEELEENSFNLCTDEMTCIRNTFPKLPLECKKNSTRMQSILHLWYTLIPFSLPIAMREADGNSLNCAYLYCPQIRSYCLEDMNTIKHVLNCRQTNKQSSFGKRVRLWRCT